jgi:hypothetical protein
MIVMSALLATGGARAAEGFAADAYYVRPALVEMPDQIGPVHVDVGETDCDVPLARPTIERSLARGAPKKKKTVRC